MFYLLSIVTTILDSPVGKLLMALLMGGILGWEREQRGRPAGLRTHILVCVGVTLMMIVSENIFEKYKMYTDDSIIRVDPARIAAQVVTGIGFLGAGTIIRHGISVRGLTTAASLWIVAGIGLAVGSGCYLPAVITTLLALFALIFLPRFELNIKRDKYKTLRLSIASSEPLLRSILEILRKNSLQLQNYGYESDHTKNEITYNFNVRYKDELSITNASDEISRTVSEIKKLGWH
ncbi:MAG: MgtC/SapB family protein [Candidatus Loosdrechtia sp.]|uniref:MgtC/SapB family protein n=1 Tax=Candidatus Loosdrechtia sp. TaxID=3101272 RepID=UPI003A5DF28A|nr:MAG: MgtC/SapB family protein [Candidatus Jettenia sp. AMX2]